MPGAQLIEVVNESAWKARVDVKLGPVAQAFETDLTRESVDESERRVTLAARARERRGRGGARATVDSSLTTIEGATRIDIVMDLTLSGSVAQCGRGMVQDISSQLVTRFGQCLEAQLVARPAEASEVLAETNKPARGLALSMRAVTRSSVSCVGSPAGSRDGRRFEDLSTKTTEQAGAAGRATTTAPVSARTRVDGPRLDAISCAGAEAKASEVP